MFRNRIVVLFLEPPLLKPRHKWRGEVVSRIFIIFLYPVALLRLGFLLPAPLKGNIYISLVLLLLQMLQNYNKWKVLSQFFDKPLSELQLREISRNIRLSLPSVKNYLLELEKEGLILKKKNRVQGYPVYLANRVSDQFRFYKKVEVLDNIQQSGLLQALYNTFLPSVVILFGSASKGEDVEGSDIDIFVAAKDGKITLGHYEKLLHRNISLFFEKDFHKLSKELRNNLLNGIILQGYIQVL